MLYHGRSSFPSPEVFCVGATQSPNTNPNPNPNLKANPNPSPNPNPDQVEHVAGGSILRVSIKKPAW